MKASHSSSRTFLDEDQWRAVAALSVELDAAARRPQSDGALRQACRDVRTAYVQALSRARAHDQKAWRRFYDLAVLVIAKTDDVAGTVSLRAFVAENEDLTLVDDGDRFDFDEETLVG